LTGGGILQSFGGALSSLFGAVLSACRGCLCGLERISLFTGCLGKLLKLTEQVLCCLS
jgi:hypothetical protein